MFSKDIVRSDSFLDLPLSSQALYFQLGMETDDRGYIPNGKAIIRLIGASKGDLELLIQKRFILLRGETLLLQKHFRMNNYVRADRFEETKYLDDLNKLFLDENKAYTERNTETKVKPYHPTEVVGSQLVYQMDTQDKISKDKLSKVNISKYKLKEIELDKTRYKHFEKCEELVEKLISSTYISEQELDLEDYFRYLDNLLGEYSTIDVKVKVDYFIKQVSVVIPTSDNKFTYRLIEGIEGIKCKFLYFKTAIDKAFREINKNNLGGIYEL